MSLLSLLLSIFIIPFPPTPAAVPEQEEEDDARTLDQIEGHDKISEMLHTRMSWHISQVEWDMDQVVKMDKESGISMNVGGQNPTPNDKMVGWMVTQFMFLFSFQGMGPTAINTLMDEWAGIDVNGTGIYHMDINLVQREVCNSGYRILWLDRVRIEAEHEDYMEDGIWKYRGVA